MDPYQDLRQDALNSLVEKHSSKSQAGENITMTKRFSHSIPLHKNYKETKMVTSKGYLLPRVDADKYAIRIFTHTRHRGPHNQYQ